MKVNESAIDALMPQLFAALQVAPIACGSLTLEFNEGVVFNVKPSPVIRLRRQTPDSQQLDAALKKAHGG
jgi:hypothetical protein